MVIGIGIGIPFSGQKAKQVFFITMQAGLMDFSITNGEGVLWLFPDNTTSTADRPAKTLTQPGTVFLYCDDFTKADIEISDNTTNANYIGDLSDFPPLTYYAHFYNTNVTGNISSLSNLTYYANFSNTNITGDISNLSNVTYFAHFYNTNVTGDISNLSNVTYFANFYGTNVTGVLNPHPSLQHLYLHYTNLSTNDTDQTVINLDTNTTATGSRGLDISGLNRTSASTDAINSLLAKGWTVTDGTVV